MRITHKTLANTVIQNLNTSMRRMNRLQEQLSSGKAITRPSDDPAGVARAMILDTTQNDMEQYQKNIDDATTWLNVTDSALGHIEEALIKARDKAIQGANDPQGEDGRKAIAGSVDQLIGELVDLGNQTYEGRYLFAGTRTRMDSQKPFELVTGGASDAVQYNGNVEKLNVEFSQGINIVMNLDGKQVFGSTANQQETFQALIDLSSALKANDTTQISGATEKINQALDRVLGMHSEVGARVQRLQMANERYDRDITNVAALRSKIEDVDAVQAMTDLKMQENGYRMALSSAARVIQPTLMDFLR